jgi:hypothetical protein
MYWHEFQGPPLNDVGGGNIIFSGALKVEGEKVTFLAALHDGLKPQGLYIHSLGPRRLKGNV